MVFLFDLDNPLSARFGRGLKCPGYFNKDTQGYAVQNAMELPEMVGA
jgi:hypothetical protein